MTVNIRHATEEDVEQIVPLFAAYREFYDLGAELDSSRRYLTERLASAESTILFASREDGTVIGFTQLYPTYSSLALAPAWVLYDLYVVPEARREGVGRALMEAASSYAQETGAAYLRLETAVDNLPAQSLYESVGYQREVAFFTYYFHVRGS